MGEWRTIDSAPRDETKLLLFFPDSYDMHERTGWWYEGDGIVGGFVGGGWYDDESASNPMTDLYGEPTHWQPLPAPPVARGDEGAEVSRG